MWCVVGVLLLLAPPVQCTKPGFRFQITQKAIDYVREIMIPILREAIETADIPDISDSFETPIGHFDVYLTNARITEVSIPYSSVDMSAPSNVRAVISSGKIHLKGDWRYREEAWPHIHDHGTVDATAYSIDISLTVSIGMTSEGGLSVSSQDCEFSTKEVKVKFHGGASWLYNLFSGKVGSAIKSALSDEVCDLVTEEIDNFLNSALSTLDLTFDIDEYCYIDYTIVREPFVENNAMLFDGKGEVYDTASPKECPSPKQPLPTTVATERMVTLWITEFMLNSLGYAYQRAGFLQYNITSQDFPEVQMTTAFFRDVLPELYSAYPDQNLTLWVRATQPVTFHIGKEGVSGELDGDIIWLVKLEEEEEPTYVTAFTLNIHIDLCVNISVDLGTQSEVYLDILTLQPYIHLNSSNIGNFSTEALQHFLTVSKKLLVIFLNGLLKEGIPLPSIDEIAFTGFDFSLQEGYIQLHTDLKYIPDGSTLTRNHTLFKDGQYTCASRGI